MAKLSQDIQSPAYYGDVFKNIKEYILTSLGYPVIKVELTEEMLNNAILAAANLFYDYEATYTKLVMLTINTTDNTCVIPPEIDYDDIKDVIVDTKNNISSGAGVGNELSGLVTLGASTYSIPSFFHDFVANFDLVNYYLYVQYLEDYKKIMGIQISWQIIDDKIHLFPKNFQFQRAAIMMNDFPKLENLEQEDWIKQYALAKSMHTLGIIRSRISGMQFSGGMTSGGSADMMFNEGKEQMAALKEELKTLRRTPLGFIQV
jgi:hypothetical protein